MSGHLDGRLSIEDHAPQLSFLVRNEILGVRKSKWNQLRDSPIIFSFVYASGGCDLHYSLQEVHSTFDTFFFANASEVNPFPDLRIFFPRLGGDVVRNIEWTHDEIHTAHDLGFELDYPNCLVNMFSHWTQVVRIQNFVDKGDDLAHNHRVSAWIIEFLFNDEEIIDELWQQLSNFCPWGACFLKVFFHSGVAFDSADHLLYLQDARINGCCQFVLALKNNRSWLSRTHIELKRRLLQFWVLRKHWGQWDHFLLPI